MGYRYDYNKIRGLRGGTLECDHPGCRATIELERVPEPRGSSHEITAGWTTAAPVRNYRYYDHWQVYCPDHLFQGRSRWLKDVEEHQEAERKAAHECRTWREVLYDRRDEPYHYFGWP